MQYGLMAASGAHTEDELTPNRRSSSRCSLNSFSHYSLKASLPVGPFIGYNNQVLLVLMP